MNALRILGGAGILACAVALGVAQQPPQPAAAPEAKSQLAGVFGRLHNVLPPGQWQVSEYPWSPSMVIQAAARFDVKGKQTEFVSSWEEGHALEWAEQQQPYRQVRLGAAKFTDPRAARSYFGLAIELQRKLDQTLGASLLDAKSAPVKLQGAEEAVRCDRVFRPVGNYPPHVTSTLLVRSKKMVLEFGWYGQPADVAWAERLLPELLSAEKITK